MKHFGSYSYRSPFKFCHYTLFTRKEAPNFEAIFMLFGSVEKSFSSTSQSCRKKKNGVNALSFVTSWLESSFNGSPLLTFWVKSKVFHMVLLGLSATGYRLTSNDLPQAFSIIASGSYCHFPQHWCSLYGLRSLPFPPHSLFSLPDEFLLNLKENRF